MTTPTQPLPATGGRYIRRPDGSLVPVEEIEAAAAEPVLVGVDLAAPDAEFETALAELPAGPAKPTVKRGGKAPAKEG